MNNIKKTIELFPDIPIINKNIDLIIEYATPTPKRIIDQDFLKIKPYDTVSEPTPQRIASMGFEKYSLT